MSSTASVDTPDGTRRHASLPSSLWLQTTSFGADLARIRSFFDDVDEGDSFLRQAERRHLQAGASRHYGAIRAHERARCQPIPAPDLSNAVTRLEVLKAAEINFTVLSLYVVSCLALFFVFSIAHAAKQSWKETASIPDWTLLSTVLHGLVSLALLATPILFILRLSVADRIAHEQIWTAALLSAGLILTNPLTDLLSSSRIVSLARDGHVPNPQMHHAEMLVFYDAAYTSVVYVYLLLSAHSYRVLRMQYSTARFYLPKLAVGFFYFLVKVSLGWTFRVALGLVPFVRMLQWIMLESSGRHSLRLAIPVVTTTLCDALFVAWVLREVALTANVLARVPYLEHRSKQLGFRCFVYQSFVFCVSFVLLAFFLVLSVPVDILYTTFDWSMERPSVRYIQLEPPFGQLALAFVYLTWNVNVAYVNLPPGRILPWTASTFSHFARALSRMARDRSAWPRWIPGATEPDVDAPSRSSISYETTHDDPRGRALFRGDPDEAEPHGEHPQSTSRCAQDPVLPSGPPVGAGSTASIPLRYSHRELYRFSFHPPSPTRNTASANKNSNREDPGELPQALFTMSTPVSPPIAIQSPIEPPGMSSDEWTPVVASLPAGSRSEASTDISDLLGLQSDHDGRLCRRLVRRKNLFVMETQLVLAQAAYLSYIPGNVNEELPDMVLTPPKSNTPLSPSSSSSENLAYSHAEGGSFAADLEELDRQLATEVDVEDSVLGNSTPPSRLSDRPTGTDSDPKRASSSDPESAPSPPQPPDIDNGTMFLVNAKRIASQHGFYLHRHISHEPSNGHAVVLVSADRVVVAFSGTRNATNWMTNIKIERVPWKTLFAETPYRTEPKTGAPADGFAVDGVAQSTERSHIPRSKQGGDAPLHRAAVPSALCTRDLRQPCTRMSSCTDMANSWRGTASHRTNSLATSGSGHMMHRSQSEQTLASPRSLWRSPRGHNTHSDPEKRVMPREKWRIEGRARADVGPSARFPRDTVAHASIDRICGGLIGSADNIRDPPRLENRSGKSENMALVLAGELATYGQAKIHQGFGEGYRFLRAAVFAELVYLYGGRRSQRDRSIPTDPHAEPVFERDERGNVTGIRRGSCRDLPLFFTGHSLGGALATYAAYDAACHHIGIGLRHRQDVACTTFGAPMAGNSVFKERYERVVETHWRFEFASDPVPKLPGILNYTAVGVQVLLDQSGMMLIDPSMLEIHWWGKLANPYIGYRLHIRASYVMALRVYCEMYRNGEDSMREHFWAFPIQCQTRGVFPELQFADESV